MRRLLVFIREWMCSRSCESSCELLSYSIVERGKVQRNLQNLPNSSHDHIVFCGSRVAPHTYTFTRTHLHHCMKNEPARYAIGKKANGEWRIARWQRGMNGACAQNIDFETHSSRYPLSSSCIHTIAHRFRSSLSETLSETQPAHNEAT